MQELPTGEFHGALLPWADRRPGFARKLSRAQARKYSEPLSPNNAMF
jgi:hypothetical protein